MNRAPIARSSRCQQARLAFSLMEVMIVMTIMGVLIAMAAPTFQLALEQSRADVAGANLRAIWSAQRLYWLDNHAYSADLSELSSLGLVDPAVVSSSTYYSYTVAAADATTFTASATRTGSSRWVGTLNIDQTGACTGTIDAVGETSVEPGYQ